MLELAWPWLLLALPLPWITTWLLPRARTLTRSVLHLPHVGVALEESAVRGLASRWSRVLAMLAWAALLLAAARPQWLGEAEDVPRSGRDLLLAVDTSGSMSTADMQVGGSAADRFSVVQMIASDFIQRRQGDRVGLILFGSNAYMLTPLTFDLKTVSSQLRDAVIGLAGRETAIGDALGLAVKRLLDRPEGQRVVILLTDGVNNAGELPPEKATELAVANKVRDAVTIDSFFGQRTVNPSANLNAPMLTRMAESTGGKFFRARDTAELAGIYQEISQLEPVADKTETLRPVDELFWLPLLAAMLLSIAGLLQPSLRMHRRLTQVST